MNQQNPPQANVPVPRVLHYFAFPGGGIGRYVHVLLTEMQRHPGVHCELACIPSYEYRDTASYAVWPGLMEITHRVPLLRRMRFALNLAVNPVRAIRHAAASGADILHLSTIPHVTFPIWSRELRRHGIRLVATAHDVRRSHAITHLGYELEQLRRMYRACACLFVHSEYQKRDLMDFADIPEERIAIVPHGPSDYGPASGTKAELRRRYGIPLDKQVALFFGDIRPDKNLDLLIRAMAEYKDRMFLVVAGRPKGREGKPASYYQMLATELGLEKSILFRTEYIPEAEVPDYFELCDWVAMPYSSGFTSQSGVLNVAMAQRRPVLITATPTIRETLDECRVGICVQPDSLDDLRRGIREFLTVQNGFFADQINHYLDKFSWANNVLATVNAYCEAIR